MSRTNPARTNLVRSTALALLLALLLPACTHAQSFAALPYQFLVAYPLGAEADVLVNTDEVLVQVRTYPAPDGDGVTVTATVLEGPLAGVVVRRSLPRDRGRFLGSVARLRSALDTGSGEIRVTAVLDDRGNEVRLRGRSDVRELSAEAARAYWPGFAGFGPEESEAWVDPTERRGSLADYFV